MHSHLFPDPPRFPPPTERILTLVRAIRSLQYAMRAVHNKIKDEARSNSDNPALQTLALTCDPESIIDYWAANTEDMGTQRLLSHHEIDTAALREELHFTRTTIGINRRNRKAQQKRRALQRDELERLLYIERREAPLTPAMKELIKQPPPPRQPTEVERKIDALRAKRQEPQQEPSTREPPVDPSRDIPDFRNYKPEDWGSEP